MKHLIYCAIAACMLYACSPNKGYTIKGQLADADGITVVLKKVTADTDPVPIDSCVIKKGKFEMKGMLEYPEYCILYAGDNGPLPLFVENRAMNIVLHLKNMQDSQVKGSPENDLLVAYFDKMSEFENSVAKVNDDYISYKLSGENDVQKEEGYMAQMEMIQQQRIDYMKRFADEHPNNIVSALIVDNNLSYYLLPEELMLYANGFDAVNSKSPWVQSIKKKADAARRIAIGQPFIDIQLPAPDGKEIALSDYAGKGKYVLIDFWASWCNPCRMANPHVVKIYNQYKDKGFEIVGVSLDMDKDEWIKAIETDELKWPQMSDLQYWQSEGAQLYSVFAIPHTVLLDKDGTILAKGLHPNELENKLAELME